MKNIISIFFFLSMLGIAIGFYFKSGDELLGNKIIGASVSFMVFVFMPTISLSTLEGQKTK